MTNSFDGCFSDNNEIFASSNDCLFCCARKSICFSTSGVKTQPGQTETAVTPVFCY